MPSVTVLLPAYNAARWLPDAINSVLQQSFTDFELLVVDDGSTDATETILGRFVDRRMRIVKHAKNRGLIEALNSGIELAQAEYLARMDADDVAHPRRLEYQIAFMQRYKDVGVCGTWFSTVRDSRRVAVRPPTKHEEISAALFFRSPFGHPTVMIRREILIKNGLRYEPAAIGAEDFDLWVRLRRCTRFANIAKDLLEYRSHVDQASSVQSSNQRHAAERVRLDQLATLIADASSDERVLHLRLCDHCQPALTDAEIAATPAWLDRLLAANAKRALFEQPSFALALDRMWYEACTRAALPPLRALAIYRRRNSHARKGEGLLNQIVLASRALRSLIAA